MQHSTIAIKEIAFQDETYLLQPVPRLEPPEKLLASIKRVGILHPPLVEEVDRGRYRILAGRNRLLAAHKLHFSSCVCRVVAPGSSPLETFTLLLEEKTASQTLSVVEQAIFLRKTSAWLDIEEAAHRFLPLLGLEAHAFQARKLVCLNNLEEVILVALHDGDLDPKVAWELEKLSFTDRMALFEIMMNLKLSVANQKKVTLISREVAVRTQTTLSAFLADDESQEILNSTELNPPQKTARFMAWLRKKQFPLLSGAEQEFKEFRRTLPLPTGATIQHAPFFEKDEITLSITFQSRQELREALLRFIQSASPQK